MDFQPFQIRFQPAAQQRAALVLLFALVLLAACVTETTGEPFGGERSDEEALRNYIQLATGYLEQGDLANARRHLNNAANLDSQNSEVFALWGLVYSREGEPGLADDSFRRALRANSANSQARNNYAAFLFAEERYEDAYEQLQTVVEDTTYANRAQAFENLGIAALRLERAEEAEYAFGRALQLNANQLRSLLELANLSLQKPNLAQAREFYRNYLTLIQFYNVPQSPRGLWVGVQVENALGNRTAVCEYGAQLAAGFGTSPEYQLYRQFLDTTDNDC